MIHKLPQAATTTSTTSSYAREEAQPNFQQHLATWLTVYNNKLFLKEKLEGLQVAGGDHNSAEVLEVATERQIADMDEHRVYTSRNDWI